jgi:hypothetical protein
MAQEFAGDPEKVDSAEDLHGAQESGKCYQQSGRSGKYEGDVNDNTDANACDGRQSISKTTIERVL